MEYKERDLVLCTVEKVTDTVTTVFLPDNKTKGTIISSEIAPGRIKFMRSYVVPNKKIVCKILKVSGEHIDLSLRRVNVKEKKQVMQEFKQKLAVKSALKQILSDDYDTIKKEILNDYDELLNFIEDVRKNNNIIKKYIPKKYQEKVQKITEKKKKLVELKYEIKIKCLEDDGIRRIKEVFSKIDPNIKIIYISAGKYHLKYSADNFKQGKQDLSEFLESMQKKAKEQHCDIEIKEEKH